MYRSICLELLPHLAEEQNVCQTSRMQSRCWWGLQREQPHTMHSVRNHMHVLILSRGLCILYFKTASWFVVSDAYQLEQTPLEYDQMALWRYPCNWNWTFCCMILQEENPRFFNPYAQLSCISTGFLSAAYLQVHLSILLNLLYLQCVSEEFQCYDSESCIPH